MFRSSDRKLGEMARIAEKAKKGPPAVRKIPMNLLEASGGKMVSLGDATYKPDYSTMEYSGEASMTVWVRRI